MLSLLKLRLEKARHFLTKEQRFMVAEELRDLADNLDRGKVVRPIQQQRVFKRLVRVPARYDTDGSPFYRFV